MPVGDPTVTGVLASSAPGAPTANVQPGWQRGLEVFAGLLAIILAGVALADPGAGLLLLAFLFAFALLWIGIWRLTRSWARPEHAGWRRTLDGVVGVGSIVISFIVLLAPGLGILTLVLLLYVGLVLIGFTWLGAAASHRAEPGWYRALAVVLGVFSLVAAVVAIIDVSVAVATLIFLLAFVLLVVGIGDLTSGITGRPYRSLLALPKELLPPAPPPASPPS